MRAIFLVFLALCFSGCAGGEAPPAQELTGPERSQVQAEVLDWADQYLEAGTNLDFMGAVLLFDQADGHFLSGSNYWSTWEAVRTGLEEVYGGWDLWEGQWTTRRVDVLSADAALLVGEVAGLLRLEDGREFDNQVGLSFILRRTPEGWKALFGHAAATRTARQ
ncbi:MAG: nuclear transport factor 2 family protein [Gemmatimonadetes bacterium]|nr:nuclear transport factor 2 family protein [Gemmatimonadota bacterium]